MSQATLYMTPVAARSCNLDPFAYGDPNVCEFMQNNDYTENIPQINYKRTQVNLPEELRLKETN